jgi:ribonuclease HI
MSKATDGWPEPVIVYTDGASRGNPGLAAIGVHVIGPDGEILAQLSEALGTETNNVAEYTALLRALELLNQHHVGHAVIRADSELMIRQMKGEYKVKSEGLRPLFVRCRELARSIGKIQYEHVRREFNKVADGLANEALDLK